MCSFSSKEEPQPQRADHAVKKKDLAKGLRMEAQTAVIKLRDDDPLL